MSRKRIFTALMMLLPFAAAGCSDGNPNSAALTYAAPKTQDDTPPAINVSADSWEEMSWDEGYW